MSNSPRTAVLFDAFAIAMNAKVGDIAPDDVHSLQARAEQVLEADDPARYAINTFATQYELAPFDAAHLADIGSTLLDAVDRINQPDPVDAGRADIYG